MEAHGSQGLADPDWCFDAVQGVSRTFAITVDVLEEPMATYICVGYLLCRVPDTIEDANHIPPVEQARLLRRYESVLDTDSEVTAADFRGDVAPWLPDEDQRNADWEVVAECERIVATFESLPDGAKAAVRPPVQELVAGMADFVDRYADQGGLRIRTIDELEEYCWYAAGTVGDLITNLLARDVEDRRAEVLRANARGFALLLQLVNIAKDVSEDFREENNVYLPAAWLREHGVDHDEVADPDNANAVGRVVHRVTRHAQNYMDDAQRYLEHAPEERGNRLAAWAIPFLLAVATSRELLDRPEDVVREGEVKISREEVMALVQRFTQGDVDRDDVAELRNHIADRPYSV